MNGLRPIGNCLIANASLRKRFAFVASNDAYATTDWIARALAIGLDECDEARDRFVEQRRLFQIEHMA
jgi:hypothetical protein